MANFKRYHVAKDSRTNTSLYAVAAQVRGRQRLDASAPGIYMKFDISYDLRQRGWETEDMQGAGGKFTETFKAGVTPKKKKKS